MPDDSESASGDTGDASVASVEGAFSVLGDETRLRILLELAEVAGNRGIGAGLAFSELRQRVGVDDSGRFNYHLRKLEDGFVEKTDGEYVARFPALAVVSAVYAGTYRDVDDAPSRTTEIDIECQLCDRPLQAHYEEHTLWLECVEHGRSDEFSVVPPGAYRDRGLEELVRVVYTRTLVNLFLARRGICLQCWGPMSIDYPVGTPLSDGADGLDELVGTDVHCERCWNRSLSPLRTVVATHPLVLGFHREHGYDLLDTVVNVTRVGDASACESEPHGTDPASATVRITLDGETLALAIDETCTVVDYRWQ